MESFRSELATDFLCQTECDHIIDPEKHVRVCVVGTSSSGDRLEGSYLVISGCHRRSACALQRTDSRWRALFHALLSSLGVYVAALEQHRRDRADLWC